MSETLVELIARIKADTTELEKGLTDAERKTEASSKKMADSLKQVGVAMTVAGIAITAAITAAIMSFTKTGSALHDLSLKTGVSAKSLAGLQYAAEQNGASLGTVEMAIRRTASALQDAKNGLAESKRAFDQMGLSIESLEGLNTEDKFMAIASAIANISDPMTQAAIAQDLFGRSGMDMLPMLSEGADGLKRMMEEGQKLTGWTDEGTKSADMLGDAFGTLTTSMTGVFNVIGSSLAPMIKDLIDKITGVVSKVVGWARENPELAKNLTIVAGAIGLILGAIGTWILLIPKLKLAWMAFQLVFTASPWGAIIAGIGLLIAAGILLWQNWDKVSAFFSNVWATMKNAVLTGVEAMLDYLEKFLSWIPGLGDKIKSAHDAISNMIDSEKVKQNAADVEKANEVMVASLKQQATDLTQKIKTEAINQYNAQKDALDKEKQAATDTYNAKKDAINKEYGIAKDESKSLIDLAYDIRDAKLKTIDEEMSAFEDAHKQKLSAIEDEYRLSVSNAENALQDQIDAIDAQTEAEDLAITRAAEQQKLIELKAAYYSAETAKDKAETKEEWDKYATEVARNELLRTREDEKNALRQQIDDLREGIGDQAEALKIQRDQNVKDANISYLEDLTNQKAVWDEARSIAQKDYADEIIRLETARDTKLKELDNAYNGTGGVFPTLAEESKILTDNYNAHMVQLDAELKKFIDDNKARVDDAHTFVGQLNTELDNIQDVDYTVTRHEVTVYSSNHSVTITPYAGGAKEQTGYYDDNGNWIAPVGFAFGGIVPGPIGMPQLVTVHGGEMIIPKTIPQLGAGGIVKEPTIALLGERGEEAILPLQNGTLSPVVNINFTQPVFFDREDDMNRFVDKISKILDRKYRLGGRL